MFYADLCLVHPVSVQAKSDLARGPTWTDLHPPFGSRCSIPRAKIGHVRQTAAEAAATTKPMRSSAVWLLEQMAEGDFWRHVQPGYSLKSPVQMTACCDSPTTPSGHKISKQTVRLESRFGTCWKEVQKRHCWIPLMLMN